MAYFDCIVGSSENSIPLTVTCSSVLAGATITCTDGTTTLTDTCPSSSPYEIIFNLPNTGTWTLSGTYSGTTLTESILVDISASLEPTTSITVDFYSAANDTVYYEDIDGVAHTITTDSSGHASATFTIKQGGSDITFISSVAKNPDYLTIDYTKTITLTTSTSNVYFMPNSNTLYWWGYRSSNLENCTSANGWSLGWSATLRTPTVNTNDLYMNAPNYDLCNVGTSTPIASADKLYGIMKGVSKNHGANYGGISGANGKRFNEGGTETVAEEGLIYTPNVMTKLEADASMASNFYIRAGGYSMVNYIYALWYE